MTTKLAPSLNGVIKITRRSLKKFQFGDDEPIELDVIAVVDQWHEINYALRELKDGMWQLPPNKVNEHAQNRLNFVQALVNDAYAAVQMQPPTLTRAEAEEFVMAAVKEADVLRNFIYPKDVETSSVPESTDRDVNFSQ